MDREIGRIKRIETGVTVALSVVFIVLASLPFI